LGNGVSLLLPPADETVDLTQRVTAMRGPENYSA
jgi:hypothetical protein